MIYIIKRLLRATRHSYFGYLDAFRHEFSFRLELVLSLLIIPAALVLGKTGTERALLLMSWLAVPLVEIINSAIEAAIDRISDEHHELSRRAKDLGSAAVFTAGVIAFLVWCLVLFC